MAIFQCDLIREKNKHNGASYLFSFTKYQELLIFIFLFKFIIIHKVFNCQ